MLTVQAQQMREFICFCFSDTALCCQWDITLSSVQLATFPKTYFLSLCHLFAKQVTYCGEIILMCKQDNQNHFG